MEQQRYYLIADSGSTKTDWALVSGGVVVDSIATQGMNPVHQDIEALSAVLADELLPSLCGRLPDHVFFYGSGCLPAYEGVIANLLCRSLPGVQRAEAHGDLLGAARALCGRNEGVACILGTGANSCLYDGNRIVANTPPLGYVLGDEGSGAVLGIRLLNGLLKGLLPVWLKEELMGELGMTVTDVIERVYRQPLANRWLASLAPLVYRHLDEPSVHDMAVDHFRRFFRHNLVQYGRRDLPVSMVGSVCWYFRDTVAEAAVEEGFCMGRVCRSPMDGLVAFHSVDEKQEN